MGYDIVIVAGQSNAEGRGRGSTGTPYQKDVRVYQMRDTRPVQKERQPDGTDKRYIRGDFDVAVTVAEERSDDLGVIGCLAFSFAREYVKNGRLAKGRRVLILHAAVGGTGYYHGEWGHGSALEARLYQMLDRALNEAPDSRIVACLWHQGEHDVVYHDPFTYEERYAYYREHLSRTVKELRARYTDPFPFIAGEFVPEWIAKNKERCEAVLKATADVCREDGRAALVSSKGLLSNRETLGGEDDIHFSRESLDLLGVRYYAAFDALTR